MNKKILFFCFSSICLFLFFSIIVTAHPGRTDSAGGHYDYSTGEYHYHHGYSAHQHKNGVCPYDNDNKSKSDNTPSSDNDTTVEYINSIKKLDFEEIWVAILCLILISFLATIIASLFYWLFLKIPYIAKKEEESTDSNKWNIVYFSVLLFIIFIFLCVTSDLSFSNIFSVIGDVFLSILRIIPILLVALIPTYILCVETNNSLIKLLVYILMCAIIAICVILFCS